MQIYSFLFKWKKNCQPNFKKKVSLQFVRTVYVCSNQLVASFEEAKKNRMSQIENELETSRLLRDWYRIHKRELPWRESSDPYIIWISEIILQQTRVAQGMDYFLRFTERFPDVASLASAEEDEVLKYWQGLGYYSRARNLHAAAKDIMERLYKPFMMNNYRLIFTDIPSAEMIKYAANSMLATRISFMNDIANLCELVGADVNMVRKGIGADSRIGSKFLYPGCGYGGSCFPKDVKALIKTAEKNGYPMRVLKAVEEVNENQKGILFEKLLKHFKGNLKGKQIAMWGLAFKPETDDMREAPALILIDKLIESGAMVKVYDPIAMKECDRRIGDKVIYATDMYDAVLDADALLLVTEWKEFRMPSWGVLKKTMKQLVVMDGRNIYDQNELQELGFEYTCIGKL